MTHVAIHVISAVVNSTEERPVALFANEDDANKYYEEKKAEGSGVEYRFRTCMSLSDFLPFARLLLYVDLSASIR